jgi:hypothetical protein
MVVQGMKI